MAKSPTTGGGPTDLRSDTIPATLAKVPTLLLWRQFRFQFLSLAGQETHKRRGGKVRDEKNREDRSQGHQCENTSFARAIRQASDPVHAEHRAETAADIDPG